MGRGGDEQALGAQASRRGVDLDGREVLIDMPEGGQATVIGYVVRGANGLDVVTRGDNVFTADEVRKALG